MAKKFLNLTGLTTLRNQLINFFASATEVAEVEEDTATYVTEIDYNAEIGFDTKESYENVLADNAAQEDA